MLTFNTSAAATLVKKRTAVQHHPSIDAIAFQEFSDVDQSVREDVEYLRAHPLILEGTVISGWTYKVESGEVVKVV